MRRFKLDQILTSHNGNLTGNILFTYRGEEHSHSFIFDNEQQRLMSVNNEHLIPFINDAWEIIEDHLKTYLRHNGGEQYAN